MCGITIVTVHRAATLLHDTNLHVAQPFRITEVYDAACLRYTVPMNEVDMLIKVTVQSIND